MGEVKEPYEGGTGSLLEIVDMMCDVKQNRMEGAVQKRCDITVCVDCIPSGSCAGRKLYSQCSDHWIHGK